MNLWSAWFSCVNALQSSCNRKRTFFWMIIFLMAVSSRGGDLSGVTSVVRVLGLMAPCYDRLLDFLHSPSLQLDVLVRLWTRWVLTHFLGKVMVNDHLVLIADGIKVAKEGQKMPGVKMLHQESASNSKAEFIMGHSCQTVSLLVRRYRVFFVFLCFVRFMKELFSLIAINAHCMISYCP